MNRAAIEQLYRAHGSMVYRRARAILQDEQAAGDAMQEVFIRAIRSDVEFFENVSPTTWLYRVTTNYCLNVLRNQSRRAALNAGRPSAGDCAVDDVEDRLAVRQLLGQLDDEVAQIAVYYYFDQMNHQEIADLLGVSRRTVGNRLGRFRKQARAALGPPEEEEVG